MFSPAGMAVKGFFGLGAKTFGNPSGATSGNGGTAPSQWNIVFQGFAAGSNPNAVIVLDQQHAIVGCNTTGEILYTSDSGNTWTTANQTVPARLIIMALATDGHGVVVAYGETTANAVQLSRSVDGGVTWADVSPNPVDFSFTQYGTNFLCVQWSDALGLFVCFARNAANTQNRCFTSPDGLIWTGHLLNTVSFNLGDFRIVQSLIVAGGQALAPDPDATIIQRSVNGGVTWTTVLNVPAVARIISAIEYDGVNWCASGSDPTNSFNYTSSNAVIWALRNTQPINTAPPYFGMLASLNGHTVTFSNNLAPTTSAIGTSISAGIVWAQITIPNSVFFVLNVAGTLYGLGNGISASNDSVNWVSQLDQNAGLFIQGIAASGPLSQNPTALLLAVGNDATNNPAVWRLNP